jgi:tRNA/tmRNA/rRNA uracil-C5-methylase (TrmA/RlmC/RlmD family)
VTQPRPPAAGPAPGDLLDVTIEKIIFGGDGLARTPGNFVVFVPFAATGESLRVRVTERRAHHARAEIVEILAPSMERVPPPCPYYGRCGGCQYQHLDYRAELRLKEQQVYEAFKRVGKIDEPVILPIIASPDDYRYRNRITVHAEQGRVGFRGIEGRELIDIHECLIARPPVNTELGRLRARAPADGHYSLRDATVPESGFFQVNDALRDQLPGLVAASLPQEGAVLLEGYCGGGFFTAGVAGRFGEVVAIDNDVRTLLDARRLNLPNVDWRHGDASVGLAEELRARAGQDIAVLVDPPREGLPVRLVEALGLDAVPHLTYVSCDPATLARDARALSPRYELVSVQPIDCFPRTAQIECVSTWRRK